jgi:thiosulfate dehydrogenase (quinone) large subunit
MTTTQKYLLVLVRVAFGALFLYAGISKVTDPSWSAAGYIGAAKNFIPFFQAMLEPSVLPIINILNSWGQVLIGLSLLLGIFVSWSAPLGALMMALYYLVLPFPYPNPHAYVVDEHVIYTVALLYLAAAQAGRYLGLDAKR